MLSAVRAFASKAAPNMPSTTPRVLIIGGGVSGLALGQALRRADIPFTIFERDASAAFRPQGYRLSIGMPGETALKQLLTSEHYAKLRALGTSGDDRGFSMLSFMGDPVTGDVFPDGGPFAMFMPPKPTPGAAGPPPAAGPHPPSKDGKHRTVLRQMLALGIEPNIEYSKHFAGFTMSPDGAAVTAHFQDGSSAEGALLIGGDGRRSIVHRDLLAALAQPPPVILDLETRVIYGKTPLTPELVARFPEKWRRGNSLFSDPQGANRIMVLDAVIFSHRAEELTDGKVTTPPDYLFWAVTGRASDFGDVDDATQRLDGADAHAVLMRFTSHWHPDLRLMFDQQDVSQCAALRVLSAPPVLPARPSHPSVTVMGDAVHAMSPTGGSGATTALRDAAMLARLLSDAWTGESWRDGAVAAAVASYEDEMRGYAGEAIRKSFGGMKMLGMSTDGATYKALSE